MAPASFAPGHPQHGGDDIQVGRFETFVRRLFSIKRSGLLRTIDEKVCLSIDPCTDHTFENRYWQGIRSMSAAFGRAASVGNQGMLYLFNPVGSKGLIVVEEAEVNAAVAGLSIALTATDSAVGAVNGSPLDSRQSISFGAPVAGFASLHSNDAAAPAGPVLTLRTSGSGVTINPLRLGGIVLTPGFGIVCMGGVNTAVIFNLRYYERVLESSEFGSG
jgi:hypothetical protein